VTKQCEEIERSYKTDSMNMHKKIRELSGKHTCSGIGCIKSEEGNIVTDKNEMLEVRTKYIEKIV